MFKKKLEIRERMRESMRVPKMTKNWLKRTSLKRGFGICKYCTDLISIIGNIIMVP